MRSTMIPVMLLALVALSSSALPRQLLDKLDADPSGYYNQPQPSLINLYDPQDDATEQSSECDILKTMFCRRANWLVQQNQLKTWKVFDVDFLDGNPPEDNYEEVTKKRALKSNDYSSNQWHIYQKRAESPIKNKFYQSHDENQRENEDRNAKPVPNIKMMYIRNKDISIDNDKMYHVYETYLATTNPFDFVKMRFYCLTENERQPLTELEFRPSDESQSLNRNEIDPVIKKLKAKRTEASDIGEKEIADTLEFGEEDKGEVQKKLFSFWSRLQSLSHKGRQLPTRRHTFVYYGPDGVRDGPLTAETRASHLRPPGQPLRWG